MRHNVRMEPKDRLKVARHAAGFERPTDAARAHKEINQNTLISHENGNRPLSKKAAATYAELFGVDAGWLLYGENENSPSFPKSKMGMIEGEQQILETIRRIKGLNDQDVLVVMSVIMNALHVNADAQSQTQPGDQLALSTPHHALKP